MNGEELQQISSQLENLNCLKQDHKSMSVKLSSRIYDTLSNESELAKSENEEGIDVIITSIQMTLPLAKELSDDSL